MTYPTTSMSPTVTADPTADAARVASTRVGRLTALGRAEFTQLLRNRTALATALLMPVAMIAACRPLSAKADFGASGLDVTTMAMTAGVGYVLLFVVHYNLVTTYVARRQELVLKRLRTGEPTDLEILVGTALPAVAVALAQCVALTAAGATLLHAGLPHRPDLLALGVVLGMVLLGALAALSTVVTANVELAQYTTAPMLLVSAAGSGLLIPLDSLPHPVARICEALPLTPVTRLVQAGWTGGPHAGTAQVTSWLALAVAWTAVTVFAVRRWFRWEPRR